MTTSRDRESDQIEKQQNKKNKNFRVRVCEICDAPERVRNDGVWSKRKRRRNERERESRVRENPWWCMYTVEFFLFVLF